MYFSKILGANWKARRRLLTPAFHAKIMESYLDVFNEKSLCHASQLENRIMINSSEELELDIYSAMMSLALDIVCGIRFIQWYVTFTFYS